nr:hypothetical protein IPBHJEJL_00161 [Klebsiella oxytoca]
MLMKDYLVLLKLKEYMNLFLIMMPQWLLMPVGLAYPLMEMICLEKMQGKNKVRHRRWLIRGM